MRNTRTKSHESGDDPPMLDRCPVCRYRLDGLPERHRCPECGFEYDKHTAVIHQGRKIAIFLLACAPIMFIVFFDAVQQSRSGAGEVGCGQVYGAVACVGAIVYAIRVITGRSRRMAIIGLDGIELFRGAESIRRFRWGEVDEVTYNLIGGDAVLRKEGKLVELVSQMFFGSDKRTREFIRVANEWAARVGMHG